MRKGFTLIELMIVIAIIAIIAAIAIPNLLESRVTANENAAASSLKSAFAAAQTQFSAGSYNDQDNDNRGEYGHLNQLTGQDPCYGNGTGTPLAGGHSAGGLTLLGREFDSASTPTGAAQAASSANAVSGYFFAVVTASHQATAGTLVPATANTAEKYWGACAVPEVFGDTGRRCFTITQDQKVFSTSPDSTITGTDPLSFIGVQLAGSAVTAATAGTATASFTAPAGTKNIAIGNALAGCFGADSVVLATASTTEVDFAAGTSSALPVVPAACSTANRTPFWPSFAK